MQTAGILVNQILIMFLLAGIGFVLFRTGKISNEGSKCIGNILIYLVLPCVIIKGFLVERTGERIEGLLLSAVIAALVLLISVLVSGIFLRKDAIGIFAAAFSNPGFFGVPLIVAVISEDAVFYIAAFIGFLNLLQWTYGVSVMTGKKGRISGKELLKAPFFMAIMIGIILFLFEITLPAQIMTVLGNVTALNTPLAMFTVGIYLAQTDLKKMFQKKHVYLICFFRLCMIPLLCLGILWFIPEKYGDMKGAILIAAACPVGSNIAVYAQRYDKDYKYAVETVVISTLFSIITIPCVYMMLAYS